MSYKIKESVFDQFFNNREALIQQFKKGDITKKEFIEEHYYFIQRLNLKPFKYRIDSFEKGIYNYQYYNMLAKYSYMKSKDSKLQQKHPQLVNKLQRDANYYYSKKDKTTLKLLEYLDFTNVEAYYIKVKSKGLKDKLFEIVLMDYDHFILHSVSSWLRDRLMEEGVFIEEKRKSLIDQYINEKY
ncbi:DUF6648 family protein [Crassaminicella profunda]|uniref:DUF6648 family protein n=1 Tax=Crassaminicella profunda TaxID=1286698 RepID=UPI001CA626EC|nr:DUF6648 family protein [Crassaminicella profunda]QZY53736.1 hypothetical protein K7H06_11755 [Crassaminicella profunda]